MTIGCCGNDRELRGLLEAADMHPRSTKAGQRARARVALVMVERRARALGDLATVASVRQSLANLGVDSTRSATVARAIARVRTARERPDGDVLWGQRDSQVRTSLESVLLGVQAVLGIVEAAIRAEAASEASRAVSEGRDPNYTAADAAKVVAWMKWFVGGPFPADVAESDLRLLGTMIGPITAALVAALTAAQLAARAKTPPDLVLSDAITGIVAYINTLPRTVAAAVAALPPPETAPPPIDLTRWARVSTSRGVLFRCGDGSSVSDPRNCPQNVRCADGSLAPAASLCPAPPPTKSSGALLALPVALLAWYLIK